MLLLISFSAMAYDVRKGSVELERVKPVYNWEFNIEGVETGGRWDYVIFGEKPDASDLVDEYDVPKCPPPPMGYVRMILRNNELPYPYTSCWFEYRQSPDVYKVWELNILWVPQSGSDDTEITLSWERTGRTEYKYIMLNDDINMLKEDNYTFTCHAFVPTQFEIVCSRYHIKSIEK